MEGRHGVGRAKGQDRAANVLGVREREREREREKG